ncbi:MAG TPA: hypothetical protein PLY86_21300 [bacterium]|nr:hypothetical protein [bacterium]
MANRSKPIDNSRFDEKIELRSYFMAKYHADGKARVFDACQGEGRLWNRLRQIFPVAEYWGVDEKPKRGRISIDSRKVLANPRCDFDVIDVDTYGSPFKHYYLILRNLKKPTTIFLTFGARGLSGGCCDFMLRLLGIVFRGQDLQPMFRWKIAEHLTDEAICSTLRFGVRIVEGKQFITDLHRGRVRYIGLRLEPVGGKV